MAKKNKNKDTGSGRVITRAPGGAIISVSGGGNSGGGGGKDTPLKQFKAVVQGLAGADSINKDAQIALAKLDVSDIKYKDLAKFGLDDVLTKDQFKEFKGLFKEAQASNNRVNKDEIKALASFGQNALIDTKVANLQTEVDKVIPDVEDSVIQTPVGPAGTVAPTRSALTNLDMSIFARRAVSRARGVRGAISTSTRGVSNFGASLARISLGAV